MLNWTEPCSDVMSEHLPDLRTDCKDRLLWNLKPFFEVAKFQKRNESQISTLSVCRSRRVFSIAALKYLCPIYEANRDDGSQLQLGVLWKGLFKYCVLYCFCIHLDAFHTAADSKHSVCHSFRGDSRTVPKPESTVFVTIDIIQSACSLQGGSYILSRKHGYVEQHSSS